MSIFSRRVEAPEAGWFQIGDMPEQAAPRRRGSGRVSLSVVQDEPDAATDTSERMPVLERANAVAGSVLGRVAELRSWVLALSGAALALVLLVVVMIASHGGGTSTASSAGALDRDQAQIAELKGELRLSQQQLAVTRAALAQARHATATTATTGTGAAGAVSHRSRKRGRR